MFILEKTLLIRYDIDTFLRGIDMIIKNKLTKETLVLSEEEFKIRFIKEIETALDSYKRTELAKPYYKINKNIESDFYFSLQYNFNSFSNSVWYIERM